MILFVLPPVFLYSALNTGTSGASFLKINVGTRSSAMGGAFVGLADDNEALLLNPAGLALIRVPEISGGHIIWFSDMSVEHAQFSLPLDRTFTLGISGVYFNNGVFDAYTAGGVAAGTFTAYDASAGLSLGIRVTDFIFTGFSVKYIMNSIETSSSTSYAADLGFIFQEFVPGVSFGASLLNVGTPVKLGSLEEQLPVSIRAGFALTPSPEAVITVDGFTHPREGDYNIAVGMELFVHEKIVCFRFGYIYPLNTKVSDFISGLSGGIGVNVAPFSFNYAIVPNSELGYLHRVAVAYAFGSKTREQRAPVEAYKPKYFAPAPAAIPEPVVEVVPAVTPVEPPPPIVLPAKTEKAGPRVSILKQFTSKTINDSQRHAMFEIIKTGLIRSKAVKTVFVDTADLLPEELNSIALITGSIEKKDGLISIKSVLYDPVTNKELTEFTSEAKSLIDIHLKANELAKKIEQYLAMRIKELDAGRLRIAVMEFKEKNISKEKADTVADFIRTQLSNNSNLIIVERNNMDSILKEQMFQKTGCTEADCAVELGKILNVEKIIVGSVSMLDKKIYINIRLVDIETAQAIFGETKEIESESELFSSCKELVKALNAKLNLVK